MESDLRTSASSQGSESSSQGSMVSQTLITQSPDLRGPLSPTLRLQLSSERRPVKCHIPPDLPRLHKHGPAGVFTRTKLLCVKRSRCLHALICSAGPRTLSSLHSCLSGGAYWSSTSGHQEASTLNSGHGCSGPKSLLPAPPDYFLSYWRHQRQREEHFLRPLHGTFCPLPKGSSVSGTPVSLHTPVKHPQGSFFLQGDQSTQ